jgi:predicted nicotinamide N-methyase
VYCTDAEAAAVALAAANGRLLHVHAGLRCRVFNWTWLTMLSRMPQVLLLSDVNYEPAAFDQLLAGIQHARQLGAEVWLSTPQRLSAIPFVEALLPATTLHLQQAVQLPGEVETMVSILHLSAKK